MQTCFGEVAHRLRVETFIRSSYLFNFFGHPVQFFEFTSEQSVTQYSKRNSQIFNKTSFSASLKATNRPWFSKIYCARGRINTKFVKNKSTVQLFSNPLQTQKYRFCSELLPTLLGKIQSAFKETLKRQTGHMPQNRVFFFLPTVKRRNSWNEDIKVENLGQCGSFPKLLKSRVQSLFGHR